MSSVYDFIVKDADGNSVPLSNFKGKVLLIVNVASKCGYTWQYKELQELQAEFKEQGFTVLAFPCNQFGGQEPGSAKDVCAFAAMEFSATFPIMEKICVNGKEADPLYAHLKEEQPGRSRTKFIKWNFTKFLVDGRGRVVDRAGPTTKPSKLRPNIASLLDSSQTVK